MMFPNRTGYPFGGNTHWSNDKEEVMKLSKADRFPNFRITTKVACPIFTALSNNFKTSKIVTLQPIPRP
jgi:hypothetical protein